MTTTIEIVTNENTLSIKYYINSSNVLILVGWFVYHYKDEVTFSHREHFCHSEIPRSIQPLISDELNDLTKQELINYINLFIVINNIKLRSSICSE